MITLRVEIMTVNRVIEEEVGEPEGWPAWSPKQRREWCEDSATELRDNLVGISYGYPEQADDDEREEKAAEEVRLFREAVSLPAVVGDCTHCGATDAQCREVIKDSAVSRSCCTTCKITNTHPCIEGS